MEKTIQFSHSSVGFLPKSTWIKSIKVVFYATLLGLIVETMHKHFLKYNKMQKGYIKSNSRL